jgi:hypothetical protein
VTRKERSVVKALVEAGGPLAEAVSRLTRLPTEPLTLERLRELKAAVIDWDAVVLSIERDWLE